MKTMTFRSGSATIDVRVKPWAATPMRRNITWAQDASGYWHGLDRGAAGDWYDAGVTVFGTESDMQAFAAWVESYGRVQFEVEAIDGYLWSPVVDQSGTVDAVIVEPDAMQRVFWAYQSGVNEVSLTLRAIQPALVSSPSPSLSSLRLQHRYEADKSTTVGHEMILNGSVVSQDRKADTGLCVARFQQTTVEAVAILRYLNETVRATSVAFPSVGIPYPFGFARGSRPSAKVKDVRLTRQTVGVWIIEVEFVEAP